MTRAHFLRQKGKIVFRINAELSNRELDMFAIAGQYPASMYVMITRARPGYSKLTSQLGFEDTDGGPFPVKYFMVNGRVAFGVWIGPRLLLGWLDNPSTCRSVWKSHTDLVLRKIHKHLVADVFKAYKEFQSGGVLWA